MVRAHLQRLVATHDEAHLLRFFVLQETNVTSATLLPLLRFLIEAEEFGTNLELHILVLFVRLHLNLVLQLDDWVVVRVVLGLSTLPCQSPS